MEKLSEKFFKKYSGILATYGADVNDLKEIQSILEKKEQGLYKELPVAEGADIYSVNCSYECRHDFDCPLSGLEKEKCDDDQPCEHMYKAYRVHKAKFIHLLLESFGTSVFATEEEAKAEAKRREGEQA